MNLKDMSVSELHAECKRIDDEIDDWGQELDSETSDSLNEDLNAILDELARRENK